VQTDPFAVDRKLREAARAWLDFRRALRRGEGQEHRFDVLGAFASRELVTELRAAGPLDPLAPSLAEWAERLHLEHATRELSLGRQRAYRTERHALTAPEAGKFTLRELVGAALADTKGARGAWLEKLGALATSVTDFEARRWERRVELANTLGAVATTHAVHPTLPAAERARRFLDATDDAFAELGITDAARLIELALGRDSIASFPGRLTTRSLAGLFEEAQWLKGVTFDLEDLPRTLGAASHLRGLVLFGAALRTALASSALPFVLAHDPFDRPGATFGALFALLPFGESFARRRLDVARARLAEHRRSLARVALIGARSLALRVLLAEPTLAGNRALESAFPELVARALGVELPARARSVLFRARVADGARFFGLLAAAELGPRLEATHDEDWYRNPRAVEELREAARQSATLAPSEGVLERGARELAGLLRTML
jgi:hypothetical protein